MITPSRVYHPVAICTGRVEAKVPASKSYVRCCGCNLHGACGGKACLRRQNAVEDNVAICTGRVEAKLYRSMRTM